jgi:hypothetical protein
LPDAPGLPEEEDARFLSDALPRTGDGARTERLSDPPEDYDHASLRVGVNVTRANDGVADAGGEEKEEEEPAALATPRDANETAPTAYALDLSATTVKGLVRDSRKHGGEAEASFGSRGAEPEPP